jgi:hypothetical protein
LLFRTNAAPRLPANSAGDADADPRRALPKEVAGNAWDAGESA